MLYSFKNIAAAFGVAALVSGCAGGPDLGDSISARGEQASQVAKDFKRGEKLVATGESNVRKGNKLVSKGEDQIRNGRSLQAQARQQFCVDVNYNDPVCQ